MGGSIVEHVAWWEAHWEGMRGSLLAPADPAQLRARCPDIPALASLSDRGSAESTHGSDNTKPKQASKGPEMACLATALIRGLWAWGSCAAEPWTG